MTGAAPAERALPGVEEPPPDPRLAVVLALVLARSGVRRLLATGGPGA